MIEVKNIFFSYRPDQQLLSGISFSLKKGEFAALLGANGVGKSTLLKLLLGKLTPTKGTCAIDGVASAKRKDWSTIGYVPQKISIDAHHPATVKELVRDASLCHQLDIEDLWNTQFKDLSGGQQQRVLVALALQHDPKYILLDEPTVGVDEKSRKSFYTLLAHLAKEHGKAILMVTHDAELVAKYAHRVLCMDDTHHFAEGVCIHA